MEYAVKVKPPPSLQRSRRLGSATAFAVKPLFLNTVTDHQQGQERPDGGGGDPAEIWTTSQHHHPQGRESH